MSDCTCPSRGEAPHSIDCPADTTTHRGDPMSSSVTTTRTFEYDEEGRIVREVTVVEDNSVAAPTAMNDTRPLAVDADGYVWRINEDGSHSMARTNPDNAATPLPLTYYVPVGTR